MPLAEKSFVLTHTVKKASELKENEYSYSPSEEHFGVPWKMGVTRKTGFLGFYLYCDNKCETQKWSFSVTQTLGIFAVTGKKLVKTDNAALFEFTDSNKKVFWGFDNFMAWDELVKNHTIDGDLVIEARVKINKMSGIEKKKLRNFDESVKQFSDVVLIVNNEKFYVSKLFLAGQSSYFEAMFLRKFDESKQSEIILNDVVSQDFQHFLELLHGEKAIDEETVAGILKVADMYDAKMAFHKCEEFLIKESEKTLKEKLQLANRFKLDKLKNECLFKINTAAEIRSVLMCNLNEMDPSVVGALLQKALALLPFT
uniref:BTB domain-containing protein n=1 Tax=Caenorhabditis tropicalis TaxID=1561998 RepID=A0A1I7TGR0_9PELO